MTPIRGAVQVLPVLQPCAGPAKAARCTSPSRRAAISTIAGQGGPPMPDNTDTEQKRQAIFEAEEVPLPGFKLPAPAHAQEPNGHLLEPPPDFDDRGGPLTSPTAWNEPD